MGIKVGTFN